MSCPENSRHCIRTRHFMKVGSLGKPFSLKTYNLIYILYYIYYLYLYLYKYNIARDTRTYIFLTYQSVASSMNHTFI